MASTSFSVGSASPAAGRGGKTAIKAAFRAESDDIVKAINGMTRLASTIYGSKTVHKVTVNGRSLELTKKVFGEYKRDLKAAVKEHTKHGLALTTRQTRVGAGRSRFTNPLRLDTPLGQRLLAYLANPNTLGHVYQGGVVGVGKAGKPEVTGQVVETNTPLASTLLFLQNGPLAGLVPSGTLTQLYHIIINRSQQQFRNYTKAIFLTAEQRNALGPVIAKAIEDDVRKAADFFAGTPDVQQKMAQIQNYAQAQIAKLGQGPAYGPDTPELTVVQQLNNGRFYLPAGFSTKKKQSISVLNPDVLIPAEMSKISTAAGEHTPVMSKEQKEQNRATLAQYGQQLNEQLLNILRTALPGQMAHKAENKRKNALKPKVRKAKK